jgi:hypothetical protein
LGYVGSLDNVHWGTSSGPVPGLLAQRPAHLCVCLFLEYASNRRLTSANLARPVAQGHW